MEAALLAFSESTGIYAFMTSPWGWPFVESLHFIGLSLLVGCVGLFDLRLLGVAPAIPLPALHRLIPFGVLGFGLNVATGLMFVSTMPDQYLYNPSFQSKLLCMLLAGLNMALFYGSTARAALEPGAPVAVLRRARLFGALSLLFWSGVIIGGRLITFYRPPYHWCFWCG
ncbi:MAG: hypothetical protein RLZZ169_62 [Pseudomonadota bacterium]|jgi:hypothetical protein